MKFYIFYNILTVNNKDLKFFVDKTKITPMIDGMKTLCKTLGGSNAYGLNTPESDIDYRGVVCNTDPATILGLSRFDVIQKQEKEDEVYYEVRKFFELLKDGNTGALEVLFNDKDKFLEFTPEFDLIYSERMSFVDTDKMFKCLRGYMQSELRLANGERTGQLGGKRKAQLEKYGFSPKNFVQLFRLAFCGVTLFQDGYFPVNVMKECPVLGAELFKLKTQPFLFTKEELNKNVAEAEAKLVTAYETRKFNYTFDMEKANKLLTVIYLPHLS